MWFKKLKEFDDVIEIHGAEIDRVEDKLTGLDPTSDEYRKAAEAMKLLTEAKQSEIRSRNEWLTGKVPAWATTLFGTVLTVVFGGTVFKKVVDLEDAGGVVSSQAINVWDKVVRKLF